MNYSINTHCPNCFQPSLQDICVCDCNRSNYLHVNRALPLFTELGGGYVIGRVIDSSGSFGMVYTAIHQDSPEIALAVKEYFPQKLAERVGEKLIPNQKDIKNYQSYLQRFEQESGLLLKCQRYPFVPGIVRAADLIHKNDTAYLVMERLFGSTLEESLKKHEKLTLTQMVGWLKPLLENLHALHKRNIFHRDLKPANIFLREMPDNLIQPVIMDFGIAREGELEPFGSTNIIGANGGGTFCYRPPEMIERLLGYSIAAHTDIYAIGAILFHCLYGKPPQDFQFINTEKAISLHELDANLITEPKLHAVIVECLKQNPKDRPKNAKVLLEKLAFLWQRYETLVPMNDAAQKANDKVIALETELESVNADNEQLKASLDKADFQARQVEKQRLKAAAEAAQWKAALADLQANKKELQQKSEQLGSYWQKRLQESEAKLADLSIDKENLQQQLRAKMTASPRKDWQSSKPKGRFLTGLIALLLGIGVGFAVPLVLEDSTKINLSAEQLTVEKDKRQPVENIAIGKNYQGGIIFYLDDSGKHGLIAAPTDQNTSIQWCNGCYYKEGWHGVVTTGATGTAVGTGQANTKAIINSQNAGSYAAKLCDDLELNGYDDWYLPSKDELNLMYNTIGQGARGALKNRGGFASYNYWSSSEYVNLNAWSQGFYYGGNQYGTNKGSTLYVRAVRAF